MPQYDIIISEVLLTKTYKEIKNEKTSLIARILFRLYKFEGGMK
jgi:hypothetical protein